MLTASPTIHVLMRYAYLSLMPQMIVAVLLLGFGGKLISLRVLTLSFMCSAVLMLNGLMLVATPVEDSTHYLADVLAGLAVSGPAWLASSRLVAWFAAAPQDGSATQTLRHFASHSRVPR